MEPPLSVQLETIADGVHAYCPELDIHSSGDDQQSALGQLADKITDYWGKLLKDDELRQSPPHSRRYELFVQKVIPFIYEQDSAQQDSKRSVGFREHVTDLIRPASS